MDDPDPRSCGECGLCCKLIGVRELQKPPGKLCAHFKRAAGCRIYESRPQSCREFICYWLHAANLDDDWRPDRAGFVMHASEAGRVLNIDVDPSRPQAWRREPYQSQLRAWAAQGEATLLELRVWTGRRCLRLSAAGDVDLGVMRPETNFAAR